MEYSDYELYQILEKSGYKATDDNLQALKEGLDSGKYEIVDGLNEDLYFDIDPEEVLVGLSESSSDYEKLTWLNENDYEPTRENVEALNEFFGWGKTPEEKAAASKAKEEKKAAKLKLKTEKKAGKLTSDRNIKSCVAKAVERDGHPTRYYEHWNSTVGMYVNEENPEFRRRVENVFATKIDNNAKLKERFQKIALENPKEANKKIVNIIYSEILHNLAKEDADKKAEEERRIKRQAIEDKKLDKAVAKAGVKKKVAAALSESVSDYELYQILEASGYKTTENNLQLLKEGLASGKYEID